MESTERVETWNRLWHENRQSIARICARRVRNPNDRDELVQAVYMRAWVGLRSFRGESSPRSWLFRIADNACRDFGRRRVHRDAIVCMGGTEEQAGSDAPGPERRTVAREQVDHLLSVLDTLSEEDRGLVSARWVDGVDYRSLAQECGLSEVAARKRLSRIRGRMQRALEAA